jgi:hypothetical protein
MVSGHFMRHITTLKVFVISYIISMISIPLCLSQKNNGSFKYINSDSLFVSGKVIVFFEPTMQELDSLYKKEGNNSETYELMSDFRYYAKIIADSLLRSKSEIITYFANQSIIVINQIDNHRLIFNKKKDKINSVGAIFSDGKQNPQYEYGVLTDIGYWTIIKKYFNENGH